MIRFEQVSARYAGAPATTVHEVSLEAVPGIVTAVVGPNGSGKTTLIRALLGRVTVTGGRIALEGVDAAALGRRAIARRVAVLLQRGEPAFAMRVREYVSLGRHPHVGAWSGIATDARDVVQALDAAGVSALSDRPTDSLSGGEWQRVRIARALAQETASIVLDEPTTFLDIAHEMETFELLSRLAGEGRTILVVSHQLNLVARFARHVVLLDHGRVVAAGSPDDVMQARVLESIYQWPLVVTRDPAIGAPTLVPLRRRT